LDLHLYALLLYFIDALYIFSLLIFPRFALNKSKVLNAQIDYSFDADSFTFHSENEHMSGTSTLQYSYLDRIGKKGNNLYLFLNRAQGYIVDLSALSPEEIALLKTTLQQHIKPRRFKWKN